MDEVKAEEDEKVGEEEEVEGEKDNPHRLEKNIRRY